MYTDDEIREKRLLARAAGLSGAELLDNIEAVKKDCNGIAWAVIRMWVLLRPPTGQGLIDKQRLID